jgi:hypothetical protein
MAQPACGSPWPEPDTQRSYRPRLELAKDSNANLSVKRMIFAKENGCLERDWLGIFQIALVHEQNATGDRK